MQLIAESINIMSKTIGPALRERNAQPIIDLAKAESAAGADFLDINIGPARKEGDKLMEWAVNTVQNVSNVPLSLDTTNPIAMEAGLKAYKGRALMNSISPARFNDELPMVHKYNAYMIGLLWGLEGMPRDSAERGVLAVDLIYRANEVGIPNEDIYIDPIVSPVSVEINQVKACIEFMSMLQDIGPGCKSVVGLSNISNGAPQHLRPILNQTYLIMLMRHNVYAAIVDIFDKDLVDIARGRKPEFVNLVNRVVDGEKPDISKLTPTEVNYVKTTRVLLGETLYSHSWLEV
jgi:5-methyltetrahydrofolate corrinoid/iron sulfur protein methyltransferase